MVNQFMFASKICRLEATPGMDRSNVHFFKTVRSAWMLAGVGIEPFKELRSGGLFAFDRGDKAQHFVPLRGDEGCVDVPVWQNPVVLLLGLLPLAERVEFALGKILHPRRKRKSQQVHRAKDHFTVATGICRMDVA